MLVPPRPNIATMRLKFTLSSSPVAARVSPGRRSNLLTVASLRREVPYVAPTCCAVVPPIGRKHPSTGNGKAVQAPFGSGAAAATVGAGQVGSPAEHRTRPSPQCSRPSWLTSPQNLAAHPLMLALDKRYRSINLAVPVRGESQASTLNPPKIKNREASGEIALGAAGLARRSTSLARRRGLTEARSPLSVIQAGLQLWMQFLI